MDLPFCESQAQTRRYANSARFGLAFAASTGWPFDVFVGIRHTHFTQRLHLGWQNILRQPDCSKDSTDKPALLDLVLASRGLFIWNTMPVIGITTTNTGKSASTLRAPLNEWVFATVFMPL